mgnify:FL=1
MSDAQKIASQPRGMSLTESIINVFIGLLINVTAQHFIFPLFGIYIGWNTNLMIAGIFTIISIIRSFTLRRVFNWLHIRKLV